MRILLWHGYLLRGSGSNIYTSNIARAWRRRGHDVTVMCQEIDFDGLDYVDEIGELDESNSQIDLTPRRTPGAAGRCRVVRPFIDRLLPVYVYDDYPGFTVKTFVDLTDAELDTYTRLNVDALATALDRFDPDAFITGHEVMGPYIAAAAAGPRGRSFLAKLHGSALEYAVKKQGRYREYARAGLSAARWVAGGSEYMIEEASRYIPGWRDRAVVVNPGCDTDLFKPIGDPSSGPTVGFVGKLIEAKGVHNLLDAASLIDVPDLTVKIVGYGGDEERFRAQARALQGTGPAIEFLGRLEHGPLAQVLPTFDVLTVPSVVPEAFGMVAAEAAACGVLPVVPDHSGIGEVGRTLEEDLGCPGLLVYDHTDPVAALAARVREVLRLPADRRLELGAAAAAVARKRWSWDHVADRLLELAAR